MRIDRLRLKNFRCFETLDIHLNPKCNILVGINGAGKSTILDALAIALGGYLSGFDDVKGLPILPEDAHCIMYSAGSRIEAQGQFPVEVYVQASMRTDEPGEEMEGNRNRDGEWDRNRDRNRDWDGSRDRNGNWDGNENKVQEIGQPSGKTIKIAWQRELNGKGRYTTYGNAKSIMDYARNLQNKVRSGDASCILPLVAYYGTGRLWLQKRNRIPHKKGEQLNRQMGYIDCIAAESNEKQMMQWFEEMTYIQLQEGKPIAELEAVKKALCICYWSADTSIVDVKFFYDVKSHELEIQTYRKKEEDNREEIVAEKFPVRMLSDGEKGIISLVADIAYRMALLNPDLMEGVLETPGVVLIDEIDLHLHPAWQKRIVQDLTNIFPNIQFIMTTHSPSVLANTPKGDIWLLDHFQLFRPQDSVYGRSVEEILRQVMDVDTRPDELVYLQQGFDTAMEDADFNAARKFLNQMKNLVGENAGAVIENQIILDVEEGEADGQIILDEEESRR